MSYGGQRSFSGRRSISGLRVVGAVANRAGPRVLAIIFCGGRLRSQLADVWYRDDRARKCFPSGC